MTHSLDACPTIAVIIPTWNLKEDLLATIESVRASTYPALHFVVVDNQSTDGSVEALAQYGDLVTVLSCAPGSGFARAVNLGIAWAQAAQIELLLLLNNDTIAHANMVEALFVALQADPLIGIVGPRIYYHDRPEKIWRAGDREVGGPPLSWDISSWLAGLPAEHPPVAVDYVTGCAMLMRSQLIAQIGPLQEVYRMYYEDADFCRRTRQAGFQIQVVPAARLWHKVSRSSQRTRPRQVYDMSRSRTLFMRRHAPWWLSWMAHAYLWGKTGWQCVGFWVQGEGDLALCAWRGTWSGYATVGAAGE